MDMLYSQLWFKPPYPTTLFTAKTVIVTGSNVGLGFEAARHFARLDAAKVILAVRNIAAGEAAKQSIETSTKRPGVCEVWPLDLSSYASVEAFAKRASTELQRIDVLMENAGIATQTFAMAEQDERTITVNVVSTFLLALLLVPKMRATAAEFGTTPHLTIVSSGVHAWTKIEAERKEPSIFGALSDPSQEGKNMSPHYPISKLLEVFAVREIAPLLTASNSGIVLNALDPGLCHSSLAREGNWRVELLKFLLARSTEVGSRTLLHAAAAGTESHGQYCSDARVADDKLSPFLKTEEGRKTQERVWKELGDKLESIHPGILKNLEG